MFEMHLTSGITDGWQGCEPPSPAKLNVKTGPLASLYFGIQRQRKIEMFSMARGEELQEKANDSCLTKHKNQPEFLYCTLSFIFPLTPDTASLRTAN